jgi:hypothetical protein
LNELRREDGFAARTVFALASLPGRLLESVERALGAVWALRSHILPPPPDRAFALVALLVFAGITTILSTWHEPWFDELQAWRIALDSESLTELALNASYEGHPLLPYLLLRALGLVSRSWPPVVIAHVMIACANAWIVLRYAPFTRLHRLLIIFGYYFVFEYAVIVRFYGLGMLCGLAACAAWCAPRRRVALTAVLLLILANTSAVGLALALALACGFLLDAAEDWPEGKWSPRARALAMTAGVLVVMVIAITLAWPMMPPATSSYRGGTGDRVRQIWFVAQSIALPAKAFLPFAYTSVKGSVTWNEWPFGSTRTQLIVADLVAVAIILAGGLVVARRRSALVIWAIAVGGYYAFFTFLHLGSTRHHGHIVVAFIAAAWLAHARPSSRWTPSLARVMRRLEPARALVLTVLLLPMIGAAWQLARADRDQQFSSGPQVVALLRRQHLIDLPIVVEAAWMSMPVAALLDRPIFIPREHRATTWASNRFIRIGESDDVVFDSTVRALLIQHCRVVVLTSNHLHGFSPWLKPKVERISPPGPRPMSSPRVDVWLATAPRCADRKKP